MRVLRLGEAPEPCFLEADVVAGVRLVGVAEFDGYHVRICRAAGLDEAKRALVVAFALSRLGAQYDLRNVNDFARYLLSTPPVPVHFRRRMIAFGSGDPTEAICSTLLPCKSAKVITSKVRTQRNRHRHGRLLLFRRPSSHRIVALGISLRVAIIEPLTLGADRIISVRNGRQ